MKNIKRFLLGILSSVFLAVGLVRAAEHFDPVNRTLAGSNAIITESAPDTDTPCYVHQS